MELYEVVDASGGKIKGGYKKMHHNQCTAIMEKATWTYAYKVMMQEKPSSAIKEADLSWIRGILNAQCDATMKAIPVNDDGETASGSGGPEPLTQAPPPPPKVKMPPPTLKPGSEPPPVKAPPPAKTKAAAKKPAPKATWKQEAFKGPPTVEPLYPRKI